MPREPILDLTVDGEHAQRNLRDPKVRAAVTAEVRDRLAAFDWAQAEKVAREQAEMKRLLQTPARDYGLSPIGRQEQEKREVEARAVARGGVPPLLTVLQEQRDDMRALVSATTRMVGIVEQQARELADEREARFGSEKVERRHRALVLGLTIALVILGAIAIWPVVKPALVPSPAASPNQHVR